MRPIRIIPLLLSLLFGGAAGVCSEIRDTKDFLVRLEAVHALNLIDPVAAAGLAAPAIAYARQRDDAFHRVLLAAALAPSTALASSHATAMQALHGLINTALGSDQPHTLMPELRHALADLALRQGETRYAYRQLLSAVRHAGASTPEATRERILHLQVRISLAAGHPHQALKSLGQLGQFKELCGRPRCIDWQLLEAEALGLARDLKEMDAVLERLTHVLNPDTDNLLMTRFWLLKAWHAIEGDAVAQAARFLETARARRTVTGQSRLCGDIALLQAVIDQRSGGRHEAIGKSLQQARLAYAAAGQPGRFPEMLLRVVVRRPAPGLVAAGRPFLEALAPFGEDESNLLAHAWALAAQAILLSPDEPASERLLLALRHKDHFEMRMAGLHADWDGLLERLMFGMGNQGRWMFYYLTLVLLLLLVLVLGLMLRVHTQRHVNQQLRQSVEKARLAEHAAEESNRLKSQFLANISHEIKTPMSGLVGMASLLDELVSDPVQRRYLATIRTCSQNLLVLLNDLLDLGRMDSGRIEIDHKRFRPAEVFDYALELVVDQAREKAIRLVPQIDGKIPDVLIGDATRIGQILTNLLINAIKFTDAGSVRLEAAFEPTLGNAGNLVLQVADTGVGIAPEHLRTIFEPFSQRARAGDSRLGGSGLGLAISRRLAELMGGAIHVESRVGRGSVFTVVVPVTRRDGRAP
jgi:signal transduction histidine kinase